MQRDSCQPSRLASSLQLGACAAGATQSSGGLLCMGMDLPSWAGTSASVTTFLPRQLGGLPVTRGRRSILRPRMTTRGWDREEKFLQFSVFQESQCKKYSLHPWKEPCYLPRGKGSAEDRATGGKVALNLQCLLIATAFSGLWRRSAGGEVVQAQWCLSKHWCFNGDAMNRKKSTEISQWWVDVRWSTWGSQPCFQVATVTHC